MSNKNTTPKLFKKLSRRFKKRKDSELKAIKESAQNPELDNVGSNSTGTIRVKGSVRRNDRDDEKLITEMHIEFKDPSFDSVLYVMNNLPSELTMDYLLEQSQYYKEYADAVERTFKKRLMDNSHSFIIGMQQIQDVKLDLHLTNLLCSAARRTLAESDASLIHKSFNVISTYQRRQRMVSTLNILHKIRHLKDIEREFHKYLLNNDFIAAIESHSHITNLIFVQYSEILCLELMRKRFGDGTKIITSKLIAELLLLLFDAPNLNQPKLDEIFQSYFELQQFNELSLLLSTSTQRILLVKCTQIICKHYPYQQAYIDRNYGLFKTKSLSIQTYRNLCKKLKPQSFMACFMDICGRVFDILHLYYRCESLLIKFCENKNQILSKDIWKDIRNSIWNCVQQLLGGLLELSSFSLKTKIKMEDLLLALHSANIFKIIGQSFNNCDSQKLSISIRKKCQSYLDHFRKTFWESMKTNFDNEMWVVLPIPSNFGIHSIKELQRNTQWTINNQENESKCDKDSLNDEINIHSKFLSGENIFDKLLLSDNNNNNSKKKPTNIFDTSTASQKCIRAVRDSSEPCITSTSLNLAKFVGKCLQIMESLDPVSYDSFIALRDSFKFYLYHVFIWFGVNVHNFFEIHESEYENIFDNTFGRGKNERESNEEKQRRLERERQRRIMSQAQKLYPQLTQVINEVNELLRSRKLAPELEDLITRKLKNKVRRPRRLPHYAKCYMESFNGLELYSAETMQGVAARFVATETLPFLVSIIKSQHGRLINILHQKYKAEISEFLAQIENVVIEFKKYMYRNVPTLLVHLGSSSDKDSIISHINNTNWNMKILKTEPNSYVSELIEIFTKIENVLSSHPTLPKFIHNGLNKEAIIYVEEQLVEAYADCKKCTTEGRALMSLDQSVLKKSYPINKYNHSWEYTTNFIQAYYLPQKDLIKWCKQHPQYPLKAHKSFVKIGRATDNMKRKDKIVFEKEIIKVYQQAKFEQQKLLKEEKLNKLNKPNLNEINKTLSFSPTDDNNNHTNGTTTTTTNMNNNNNNNNDTQ